MHWVIQCRSQTPSGCSFLMTLYREGQVFSDEVVSKLWIWSKRDGSHAYWWSACYKPALRQAVSRCPVLEVVFPWPSQTPGHPMPSGGGDAAPPARRPCGAALPGPQPSPALGWRLTSLASLVSKSSCSDWNYSTGCPACRWQIMRLPVSIIM